MPGGGTPASKPAHDHTDAHGHHHDHVFHTHAPAGKMRRAFWLTAVILAAELAGGWLSHSLALLSDAGHVLTDIAAIGLAWYALHQDQRPANARMTFGYHRSGILAALINAVTLWGVAVVILLEAYQRLRQPQPIIGGWLFASAAVGLGLNLYLAWEMRDDHQLNVRSAVLHMIGDAAASAAVIVGGAVMAMTGWYVIDPLLSAAIALLIAFGAWRIVRQTVNILMEGIPHGIELERVVQEMLAVDGVRSVHDVHIWSITSGRNALSCHVVMDGDLTIRESQAILRDMEHRLEHLGIGHVTIQTEDDAHPHESSVLCCGGQGEHPPH
ncbi:MAG: cation diffusion facilitator family transporter [Alicyclobacillus macrosporangiidus]|uniref:cation diffusion facilitator family transporter n=1 Tax=Alicyclobacillus macrosporangiidus TaxID=392015 RepID=UPI0026EE2E74|nr:cation diffusion facilitator family transporter [Alicyclobacillus macrosporangiidus]MCL6600608.1 cation diffusion facilitator family transporter [Alicyclobacillus macrosporangiidus]